MTFISRNARKLPLAQFAFLSAILLSGMAPAYANIVILTTRVIYPEKAREVTIRLENKGDIPSLVQSWIDKGNPSADLNKLDVPFILMPPVFRVDAHKGQTLRLAYTGKSLPEDRESIFWLNVLDIPPKSDTALPDVNTLQMAIRSRIKIFFRPEGLTAQGALSAAQDLAWSLGEKPGSTLTAHNKSNYYINISSAVINVNGTKYKSRDGEMLAPGQSHEFTFPAPSPLKNNITLSYTIINDFGGSSTFEGIVNDYEKK